MTDCDICAETFNKTTRKPIECLYCGFHACRKCISTFLLENTIVPKCMSCKAEWNMEYLRTQLTKSFMDSKYREHQKDALLAEQEATLGDLQPLARFEVEKEKLWEKVSEAEDKVRQAQDHCRLLRIKAQKFSLEGAKLNPAERQAFFMACPRAECRGKLSSAYKCGMCVHWFCPHCHVDKGLEKDDPHECNPDDVATVKLLKENTRPCPKCHEGIYKVSGCDQMWCVSCHTCFSWKSGNILNGVVHNPHFYEFQRRKGNGVAPRNAGDIPCGGIPNLEEIRTLMSRPMTPTQKSLEAIHRLIVHLTDQTMPRVLQRIQSKPAANQKSGILFLQGLINRLHWRESIYRTSRNEEKQRRYYQILETLTHNSAELFRQWVAKSLSETETLSGCTQLLDYSNEEFGKMQTQFSMSFAKLSIGMETGAL